MSQSRAVAHLTRVLTPEEQHKTGDERADQLRVDSFDLTIRATKAGPEGHEAVSDEFGPMLVGVGTSKRKAIEDLLEAVVAAVDVHIERRTYTRFMCRHFAGFEEQSAQVSFQVDAPAPREFSPDVLNRHVTPWSHDLQANAVAA